MYSTLCQTWCSSQSRMLIRGYWSSVTCIQLAESSLGRSCHASMRALSPCHSESCCRWSWQIWNWPQQPQHLTPDLPTVSCRQSRWGSSTYFIKQSFDLLRKREWTVFIPSFWLCVRSMARYGQTVVAAKSGVIGREGDALYTKPWQTHKHSIMLMSENVTQSSARCAKRARALGKRAQVKR
jgi:hypothetical protein